MNGIILPDNHFIFKYTNEIISILQSAPNHKIKYFNYWRYFNNGLIYGVMSAPYRSLQHHLKKGYVAFPLAFNKIERKIFNYIAIPNLQDGFNQVMYDYANLFDLHSALYSYEVSLNYFDAFVYTYNGPEHEAINYYLNNLDLFEKFKILFKEKASTFIKEASLHAVQLPKHMQTNFYGLHNYAKENALQRNTSQVYLTKRETDCMRFLIDGMSTKQMAKELHISPRTVETHLEHMKSKTRSLNKYDLIYKLKNIHNL